mgnify:CR=1 FL=1
MSHKINPIGFRIGVSKGWNSIWFEDNKSNYKANLHEDLKIREVLERNFKSAGIDQIVINRTPSNLEISVSVVKPGVAIGREGTLIESVKKELGRILKRKDVNLKINGIKDDAFSAEFTAYEIASGIEARRSVKSLVKKAIDKAKKAGVKGMRIWIAGRLTGGEYANSYKKKFGRMGLHSFRSDIDYAYARAHTINAGILSVKVWIYKNDKYDI